MWPKHLFRWFVLIALLWSQLALGRWLLHQSQILHDDIDPWAITVVNLLIGVLAGTWLVFCQRLMFAAQPWVERAYWFVVAVFGLWVVAPDSTEIHQIFEHWYQMFIVSTGRLGNRDRMGVLLWQWGMIVPFGLWMVHPVFREIRIDSARLGESTGPLFRDARAKRGIVGHPWFVRSLVVIGVWWWLRSAMDIEQLPSEAYLLAAIMSASIGVGAVLATIPYYIALTLQRRLIGFLVFHATWFTFAGVAVAIPILLGSRIGTQPGSLMPTILVSLSTCLVGFATTMAISFWSSCCYRDRASLRKSRSEGAEERPLPVTSATETSKTIQPGSSPYGWTHYVVIACAAGTLLGAIHWGTLFGQQNLHLCMWMMSDSNHWGRATSIARLQSLQDSDPEVPNVFHPRHWRLDSPLIATFNGTVQCMVTAKMANDPTWSPLRMEIEQEFRDAFWSMEFPVSDPDDVRGSAYSSLQIDGQRLPLRNLPSIVYSRDWHVYGGTIEAADFARGAESFRLSFYGCEFADIDFQATPTRSYQTLVFSDCTFFYQPRRFPRTIHAEYRLSRPEEFLQQYEILIESLYNDVRVTLEPPESELQDAREMLDKLPEQWRNLVSVRTAFPVLSLDPVSMGQQLARSGNLPPNFRTRRLETDEAGRVIGIDFQNALRDHLEAVPIEFLTRDPALEWMSFRLGRVSSSQDIKDSASLLERSWLLEIDASHPATVERWSDSLNELDSMEAGIGALYISGTPALLTSDLLSVVPNLGVLVVDSQAWPTGFRAAVEGMPNLKHLIVLTAGDKPDPIEATDLRALQGLKGPKLITMRRPSSTSELVPLLRQAIAAPSNENTDD